MLKEFLKIVKPNQKLRPIVGHYIKGFDIPFISKRMLVHGLGPLFPFGSKPWDMNAICTLEMVKCGSDTGASLDSVCKAFGIKSPKSELPDGTIMNGSRVHEMYLDKRYDIITDYCNDDVRAAREVYNHMTRRK